MVHEDPTGPRRYPFYVHSAQFLRISWRKPALFGRVLKELTSLRALWISDARSDQLPSSATFGEFGKALEFLTVMEPVHGYNNYLFGSRCSVSDIRIAFVPIIHVKERTV